MDHTFYFEGEGRIKDIIGNYTAYRTFLKQEEKKEKKAEKEAKVILEKNIDLGRDKSQKRKLSYKEKQEFQEIERELESLNEEKFADH